MSGLDFLGPDIKGRIITILGDKGRIITILGDTRPCANALQLAEKADVLVHEATFAAGNEEMAVEYFHSTTTQAANIAKEAGVQELILNHISSRYLKADWDQLVHEARNIFPNTQLSNDFSQMTIAPHKS